MNLIDAIKSGKPYKRAYMKSYITFDTDDSFSGEDVLALDWEIEEPKVEITESEFWQLVVKIMAEIMPTGHFVYQYPEETEMELKKQHLQNTVVEKLAERLFSNK